MAFDRFTDKQLAKELRKMNLALEPIINQQFKELLIEVERRLGSIESGKPALEKRKKVQQNKKQIKREFYLKCFYS